MFAKLYETEETGQVLVKIDDGEKGPEVRYYCVPEGLGVCSMALEFTDDDKGTAWDKADKFFEAMTEENAIEFAKKMILSITEFTT